MATNVKKTTDQLAAELVKPIKGLSARRGERDGKLTTHVRIEASDGKQVAFVHGRTLFIPPGMIPEGAKVKLSSAGRAVLPVSDDMTSARTLLTAVLKGYTARKSSARGADKE